MTVKTVAMLTAGGLAPCLSSAVGGLIERYSQVAPDVRIIAYLDGYAGLLTGRSVEVTPAVREQAHLLHQHGGSPIGNSRVKLTNVADCVRRGLVQEGQDPLHVAAEQLTKDGVDVLHTIGGDDTNTTAADLAAYLHENDYELTVVGQMPDHRQDIHGQRPGEDALPEFVLDESADVAGPLPQRAVPGHDLDLVIEARDPLAAQPGGGLEGGDDEFLELPAGVQRGQGVDHRHDRRPRIGDDPQRPVLGPLRVDLGGHERHLWVAPEDRGVVDDDNTSPRGIPNPVVDDGWRDVDDGHVDIGEEFLVERLDDQLPATDGDDLTDVLGGGRELDPVPDDCARRQNLLHHTPNGTRGAHDGKRHGSVPAGRRRRCHGWGNAQGQRPVPA